jgi:osmoprotectant transport system ATP-binding protein
VIRLDGLGVTYPGTSTPAVEDVTLEVERGEIVVLVGPSGCGKTTTLKTINRLVEATRGTITVDGDDITTVPPHELRRGIGYVVQSSGLLPHRTVRQNVGTVPRLLGWDADHVSARVEELVALMDLEPELLERYPGELSGGQRQRVGVARALAADPPVLLMDEPFGAVDPIVRGRLQDELLALQARVSKTIVLVTHDVDEAVRLADRVVVMRVGGTLAQVASPDDLLRAPADEFVADLLGGDRTLRRLALHAVDAVDLGPVEDAEGLPQVPHDATQRSAIDALVEAGTDRAVVVDDTGAPTGVLRLDQLTGGA